MLRFSYAPQPSIFLGRKSVQTKKSAQPHRPASGAEHLGDVPDGDFRLHGDSRLRGGVRVLIKIIDTACIERQKQGGNLSFGQLAALFWQNALFYEYGNHVHG